MEVEFTYSSEGVVIKFTEPREGFLQNLLKRPEKTNIPQLSKADQHVALALAD